MNKKSNHTNLFMNEVSSFVKKIRSVLIGKKNLFLMIEKSNLFCSIKKGGFWWQEFRSVLLYLKEWFFDDKNADLFWYIFKKKIF